MADDGGLMGMLGYRSAVLATGLSASECRDRLRDAVASPWAILSMRPVMGFVDDRGARLWKHIWYRNAFQTILTVRFQPDGPGTRLECRWGTSISALVLVPPMILLTLFFGVVLLRSRSAAFAVSGGGLAVDLLPLLPVAVAVFVVVYGRVLASGEGDYLWDFVAQTTGAGAGE